MSIDYDYYFKIRENYTDLTEKNGLLKDMHDMINRDLQTNMITEFEAKMGIDYHRKTVTVNFEREIECLLQFKRMKEAVLNSNAREIVCKIGDVKTGDYITHIDDQKPDDIRTYIIRNMVDRKFGYDKSYGLLCQKVFKVILPDKTIKSYPIHFSDNKTMMMESDSKMMTLPADVIEGYVQEDRYTLTWSNDKRFVSNGEVFEVVGIDKQTMNGLITLRLKKTQETQYDNMELEIADYYKHFSREEMPEEPELEPSGYELSIIGEGEIYTGFDDDYTATVKVDGVPLNGLQVDWSITNADNTTTPYATIQNAQGYGCTILASNNTKHIGKIVILRVYLRDDSSIYAEKTIKIKPLF